MSIKDHKDEVIRWLSSPEGTIVWVNNSDATNIDKWYPTPEPIWLDDAYYIVDDEHAEIRKEWFSRSQPPVQVWDAESSKWIDCVEEPEWDLTRDYRIKPVDEWKTPEGEDPIAYHAKRIDPDYEPDWLDENKFKHFILYDHGTNKYGVGASMWVESVEVTYMSEETASAIADALNNGELEL